MIAGTVPRRPGPILAVAALLVVAASVAGWSRGALAQDAEEHAKQLVVMIRAKLAGNDVVGAGLIVGAGSDRLYIATANHVVRQGRDVATELRVQFRWLPGEQTEANLLTDADLALDLAVLSVSGLRRLAPPKLAFDSVGDGGALKRRDPVYTIGYPDARPWYTRVTPDHVAEISVDAVKFESTFVTQGHSGGALVNDHWQLIGLIRADQPPEGIAIPIERVLERLRQWNYPIQLTRRDARTARPPGPDPAPVTPVPPKEASPPRDVDPLPRTSRTGFASIVVGATHTCGLLVGGATWCWGDGKTGQLGNGSTAPSLVPVAVSGAHTFRLISGIGPHTCGLTEAGEALCWGFNRYGQVGNNGKSDSVGEPAAVAGGLAFASLSAGYLHTCGVTRRMEAYCWGSNRSGELGIGSRAESAVPVGVAGGLRVRTISAGGSHSCALTADGSAYCWGGNERGELGDGSRRDSPVPTPVAGKLAFRTIAAGLGHTCAVATDGRVYCWGSNRSGQLGNGSREDSATPVQVTRLEGVGPVATGWSHSCALVGRGTAFCWGSNSAGQLGTRTKTDSVVPVAVAENLAFRTIRTGGKAPATCGVTTDGVAACWGANDAGQFGNGTTQSSLTPVRIPAPSP